APPAALAATGASAPAPSPAPEAPTPLRTARPAGGRPAAPVLATAPPHHAASTLAEACRAWPAPRAGLNAVAEGPRHLGFRDDHELMAAGWAVHDALHASCLEMETSPPARRPSAGAVPGRCGLCLAARTHRPLYLLIGLLLAGAAHEVAHLAPQFRP